MAWTEQRGYAAATEAAGGKCMISGVRGRWPHHHRKARSQGGGHEPWNLLVITPQVHDWIHAHPDAAKTGGWIVDPVMNPARVPVWLQLDAWYEPTWWLLEPANDGGPFLARTVDPCDYWLPIRPLLPPGVEGHRTCRNT